MGKLAASLVTSAIVKSELAGLVDLSALRYFPLL